MKKSWISVLLPDDEYKDQKMVYFFAEASLILFAVLAALFCTVRLFPNWNVGAELALGICIVTFLVYVGARYIFSGIEYTEIATEKAYKKEKKRISLKSLSFVIIFLVLYLLFYGIPDTGAKGIEILVVVLLGGFFMFFTSYFSLKRSYKKNKDILED